MRWVEDPSGASWAPRMRRASEMGAIAMGIGAAWGSVGEANRTGLFGGGSMLVSPVEVEVSYSSAMWRIFDWFSRMFSMGPASSIRWIARWAPAIEEQNIYVSSTYWAGSWGRRTLVLSRNAYGSVEAMEAERKERRMSSMAMYEAHARLSPWGVPVSI